MTTKQPLCWQCLELMRAAGLPVADSGTLETGKCVHCRRRRPLCGYIVVDTPKPAQETKQSKGDKRG